MRSNKKWSGIVKVRKPDEPRKQYTRKELDQKAEAFIEHVLDDAKDSWYTSQQEAGGEAIRLFIRSL